SHLGLIDSYWALILPTAVSALNVLIVRNFFMGIERAITDAARIDGAGEWRVLGQNVPPMSKAVTAVIALFFRLGDADAVLTDMLQPNEQDNWTVKLVV